MWVLYGRTEQAPTRYDYDNTWAVIRDEVVPFADRLGFRPFYEEYTHMASPQF
jgi:hypothetical protein